MVSSTKKKLVEKIASDIRSFPIVGVVNLSGLPAPQLQKMRSTLTARGIKLTMARKSLLSRSIEASQLSGISQLSERLKGMPALIFTKDNPFALYATLQKSKSEAPAKAGQASPHDIVIKAGPTNFAPGPIISELASVGIKTKVENGKLSIISDTIVAKEGQTISPKLAETLKRLDIKPMEIGLDLVAVYENGSVYAGRSLRIDEAEYFANFTQAARHAINLSVESCYPTAATAEIILQKAFRDAKTIALEGCIITEETSDEIIAQAEREARGVKGELGLNT